MWTSSTSKNFNFNNNADVYFLETTFYIVVIIIIKQLQHTQYFN